MIKESLAVSEWNNVRAPLLRGVIKVEILNLCAGYFYNFYSNEKIEHTTSVIVSRYSFEKVRGDTALHPYGCTVQGFITKLQICSINSSWNIISLTVAIGGYGHSLFLHMFFKCLWNKSRRISSNDRLYQHHWNMLHGIKTALYLNELNCKCL